MLHALDDLIRVMGKIPIPFGLTHTPFAQNRMDRDIHLLIRQVDGFLEAKAGRIKRPEKLDLLGNIFGMLPDGTHILAAREVASECLNWGGSCYRIREDGRLSCEETWVTSLPEEAPAPVWGTYS